MRRTIILYGLALGLALPATGIAAGSTWVDGYYRDDGTYVQVHYRSNPDGVRWNNFGPSQSDAERYNPSLRDYDNDGPSNQFDMNDDSDLYMDDFDSNQYGD